MLHLRLEHGWLVDAGSVRRSDGFAFGLLPALRRRFGFGRILRWRQTVEHDIVVRLLGLLLLVVYGRMVSACRLRRGHADPLGYLCALGWRSCVGWLLRYGAGNLPDQHKLRSLFIQLELRWLERLLGVVWRRYPNSLGDVRTFRWRSGFGLVLRRI
jgi:hypothetical protein